MPGGAAAAQRNISRADGWWRGGEGSDSAGRGGLAGNTARVAVSWGFTRRRAGGRPSPVGPAAVRHSTPSAEAAQARAGQARART
eukprot:scaffold27864_cov90-Isochrysis_galbana.AAC.4